jgi:hypothetical protein
LNRFIKPQGERDDWVAKGEWQTISANAGQKLFPNILGWTCKENWDSCSIRQGTDQCVKVILVKQSFQSILIRNSSHW